MSDHGTVIYDESEALLKPRWALLLMTSKNCPLKLVNSNQAVRELKTH